MATRKITYLDPSPKYMRTRTPSTASIMSTSKLLGPPGTGLIPEPHYLTESAQRVRIPTSPLPSSIPQLQDLSTRNIMTKESNILFLSDIIKQRTRKQDELEYYEQELKKLEVKLIYLREEIKLTNLIIHVVTNEKIVDIHKYIESKVKN
jgi:hypothetical protein